jgi:alginate O-acetyltransferase complex protein AlgI
MLFLESWFWIFAAAAIPLYWLCPRRLKLYWLLVASLVFQYHFAGPAGMAPIVFLATVTYLTALRGPHARGPSPFAPAAILVVGALAYYKYAAFLLQAGGSLFGAAALPAPPWGAAWRSPAIPLGISFFSFEFLHYLYEVRVGGRQPIRNPVHFSIFAVFFPTLAAGPIKRFPDFVPQLTRLGNPAPPLVWSAARRVIRGLFKKICIADLLVESIKVFEGVATPNAPVVALLAVTQGFRIYYDFAGYSDIAIGLAQMMNLRVPENFNRPYLATSLQEFWRRWHISLSTWIRDYIYIPLGGNRVHRALNLLAAMFLCGLWHGPAWHFAAWGLYHGMGLAAESAARRWRPAWFADRPVQRVLGWAICYAFVTYGWLVFFYPLHQVYDLTRAFGRWDFAH